jgi:hypothetical protein
MLGDSHLSSAMTFWVREEDENGSAAVAERRVGAGMRYTEARKERGEADS